MIKIEREDEIREYYELRQLLKEKGQDFQAVISHPTYALPFLNPGRLVEVKDGDVEFGWGIVVAYNKIINPKVCSEDTPSSEKGRRLTRPGTSARRHRVRPTPETLRC